MEHEAESMPWKGYILFLKFMPFYHHGMHTGLFGIGLSNPSMEWVETYLLALEHYNRVLKEVIKKMGPNASNQTAINRFCKCVSVNKQLMDNFDMDCKVIKQSGLHVQKKCLGDFKKIVQELVGNNIFKCSAGRTYKYFNGCSPSLLSNFNLHEMFRWIDGHKTNIYLKKTAR